MKNLLVILCGLALCSFSATEETYHVDTKASVVEWIGKKTTGQHNGNVLLQSGSLKFSNGTLLNGEFVLNMNSISVTDIKDAEDNQHLVNHLKSNDFFSAEKHPTANLKIKKIEKSTAKAGASYLLTADLTIKGITNEIQFPASIEKNNNAVIATASFNIDRTKWNVVYKSKSILGSMADKFIYDDIAYSVKLVLQKQK